MQALILLLCSLFPLIVGTIFVYNYYAMWKIATAQKVTNYNQCVLPYEEHTYGNLNIDETTTWWKWVFLANFIMYAIQMMFTCCLCLTWIWYPFGRAGHYGHCICCVVHLAVIIFTGVARYNKAGMLCSEMTSRVPYGNDGEDFEYAEHGKQLEGLFITACTLFCFYNFFISVLSRFSDSF